MIGEVRAKCLRDVRRACGCGVWEPAGTHVIEISVCFSRTISIGIGPDSSSRGKPVSRVGAPRAQAEH